MTIEMSAEYWQVATGIATVALLAILTAAVLYGMTHERKKSGGRSESRGWAERLAREPVRVRTAILGLFAVAASFGLPVSDLQQGLIVAAVLGVLGLFSETTRAQVTPVEHPNMEAIEKAQ